MSGSSLDGLDIGIIDIIKKGNELSYEVIRCDTIEYSTEWKKSLTSLPNASAKELANNDMAYSRYMSELIRSFLKEEDQIDYVSLHGHTLFHEPENGFTYQLGNGGVLSARLGLPVVCDFRSKDIGLGGKGTPLAPIVDSYFYNEYEVLINLGGICNLTFLSKKETIAWDVCPCNQLLNFLSEKMNLAYDKDGLIARNGKLNLDFLNILEKNPYYSEKYPKSLDNQYIKQNIIRELDSYTIPLEDQLHTTCIFVARQIKAAIQMAVKSLEVAWPEKILITGGSAHNAFLIQCIKEHCAPSVVSIPDETIINYKEIILMALCAYLRVNNQENTLSEVTGSSRNSIGGAIYESK